MSENNQTSSGGIGCLVVIIILIIASWCDCDGSKERDKALRQRVERLEHVVRNQQGH